ncbi:MAG TPA: DUF4397 domain-containing protein [Puia sp.]|nr:DUF4397 domain-containing protein [Puia sp.]
MRKRHRILSFAVLLFVLVIGGVACTKSSSSLTINPISYVSLINEATYSGTANLYLNDTLVTVQQGISAGTFSTRYGTIRPGTYSVKFVNASTVSLMGSIPGVSFDTLNFYTLIVCNTPGGGSASQAFQVWDNFSNISTSNSNYRFFNLCPDYPSVDVYLNNNLVQSGRTTADNAGNATLNSFQSVSPGNYTVTVKMAGTDSVVATVNTGLFQGDAYTIFLGGNVKSHTTPVQVNVLQASY